ncbi:MAG: acyl-ACP thioesterase domain-containing protein, partial [Actinomycetota bacterium]
QDVSDDDTTDAGLSPELAWVVRRTAIVVDQPAVLGEDLTFTTYCSALGKRWADRRLDIEGSQGARYQVTTLWICVDPVAEHGRLVDHDRRPSHHPRQLGRQSGVGGVVVGDVLGVAGEGVEAEASVGRRVTESHLAPPGEPAASGEATIDGTRIGFHHRLRR